MNVTELNKEQLNELKNSYFYNTVDEEDYPGEILGDIQTPDDIPDDVIFNYYDGFTFTTDDFFCTTEQ